MIRISSLFIATLYLLLSAGAALAAPAADSSKQVTVQGNISGAEGDWVYLSREFNFVATTDSARVQNGQFVFQLTLPEPLICTLHVSGSLQMKAFWADSDTVSVTVAKQALHAAVVKGSPEQEAWMAYSAYLNKVPPRKAPGDTAFAHGLDRAAEAFIRDYRQYRAAAMILHDRFLGKGYEAQAVALYKQLTPAVQKSVYGQRVSSKLNSESRTGIGLMAPAFELPDSNGVMHNITAFRGKVLLIDFWASWCVPCRKENPGLVKAYAQYKSRGFDIMSVSLDSNKPQWLAAAAKDGLTWLQVSDLKAYNGPVPVMYGLNYLPQNVLVDREGKIIAKNLRGEKVAEILASLFP
ncbi:peroxiredoxin [Filimonas zeae]|uniref:TlpA disulfide reductase family protein n=1 Tax=Filimonas zeae TaxID=1737353 RepID=UPI001663C401|nr:TlpA disulfide reductase family protein [Filimonas zeae]MDR6337974.1 peroxiredoxin [Filimonas zeae]